MIISQTKALMLTETLIGALQDFSGFDHWWEDITHRDKVVIIKRLTDEIREECYAWEEK